jgi:hypothetical protein
MSYSTSFNNCLLWNFIPTTLYCTNFCYFYCTFQTVCEGFLLGVAARLVVIGFGEQPFLNQLYYVWAIISFKFDFSSIIVYTVNYIHTQGNSTLGNFNPDRNKFKEISVLVICGMQITVHETTICRALIVNIAAVPLFKWNCYQWRPISILVHTMQMLFL